MKVSLLLSAAALLLQLISDAVYAAPSEESNGQGSPTATNNDGDLFSDCSLFMAPSFMSDDAWGMYAGKEMKKGDKVGPPQVAIQVVGLEGYMKSRESVQKQPPLPAWSLGGFVWNPDVTGATWDARDVQSFIAGPGTLALTSDTSFINIQLDGMSMQSTSKTNGARTQYSGHTFSAQRDIQYGQELFISSGSTWDSTEETAQKYDQPTSGGLDRHLEKVDRTNSSRILRDLPKVAPKDITNNDENSKFRMRPWLEEHGMCIDHMEVKPSSIPSAGLGAFAKRRLPKGAVVTPVPALTISKHHLDMMYADKFDTVLWEGQQLLLNYAFGHPTTSLVFVPYALTANLINHNRNDPNVRIQWSPKNKSKPDQTPEELLQDPRLFLFEIVALRDISSGEEIVMDYGENWQRAWDRHDDTKVNKSNYQPAWTFQQLDKLRTMESSNPYPANVQTMCSVDYDSRKSFPVGNARLYQWKEPESMKLSDAVACQIKKAATSLTGTTWYTIQLEASKEQRDVIVIENVPRHAITLVDKPYTKPQYLREAFRHVIEFPDEDMIPEIWRDEMRDSPCGQYTAPSGIPHSGLGIYTGNPIPEASNMFFGEIVIQVEDFEGNMKLRRRFHNIPISVSEPDWIMDNYFWNPDMTKSGHEADDVVAVIPGLGMLANSHTGLINADIQYPERKQLFRRQEHPGAGATTEYHQLYFESTVDMPAGAEVFVEYGDTWFADRVAALGVIPLSDDFETANNLLDKFSSFKDISDDMASDIWDIVERIFHQKGNAHRVWVALPKTSEKIKEYTEDGTAFHSIPAHKKPTEWLEENGRCMDNIKPGLSTLDQAGHGAFATRPLKKGTIIAPLPVVHMHRRHLEIYDSDDPNDPSQQPWFLGYQQLLNYCFGHPHSNMLLFAYSPVVNYMNHNATRANAEVRWSNMSGHQTSWLERNVEDIMIEDHAGLIMEVVATTDISPGEEVLLDYGNEWEKAWQEYIASWEPEDDEKNHVTAGDLSDPLKWVDVTGRRMPKDLDDDETYIMCYTHDLKDGIIHAKSEYGREYNWQYSDNVFHWDNAKPCDIIARNVPSDGETRRESVEPAIVTYDVLVYENNSREAYWNVKNLPRCAIEFFDEKYRSNLSHRQGFRKEIKLPDGMLPHAWRDRAN